MFCGCRVSVSDDENVLEIDIHDGHILMKVLDANHTLKSGKNGQFYVMQISSQVFFSLKAPLT